MLVIEDDEPIRLLFAEVLAGEGYRVRTAADGTAGLAVLKEWRPDTIVLDVGLPAADAAAFRAAQRDLPGVADVPVLLVSATRAAELERTAGALGAAAWLAKPFDLDDLLAALARLTGR